MINPQPNTLYKQAQIDIKESLYASRENAPLGTMHDQAPGLPEGMEILTTTFGRPVVKGKNHILQIFFHKSLLVYINCIFIGVHVVTLSQQGFEPL